MLDNILSVILLLITGVVAIYVGFFMLKEYFTSSAKKLYLLFWGISFIVLFVSAVLIIFLGFDVLGEPLIPVIAALIPIGIAVGLLFAVYDDDPKYGWAFFVAEAILMVITAIARLGGNLDSAGVIVAIHIPAGAMIMLLPLIAKEKNAYLYTLGGVFSSVGGSLLAFVAIGSAIIDVDTIFLILPSLWLISVGLFTLGIILPEKWKLEVPIISPLFVK